MQFTKVSAKAIKIAASPPYRINERKIIESEKLKKYLLRGSLILICGVTSKVKAKNNMNPQPKIPFCKYTSAKSIARPPLKMTVDLQKRETLFCFIEAGVQCRGCFLLEISVGNKRLDETKFNKVKYHLYNIASFG